MKKDDALPVVISICLIFFGCAIVKFTPTGKTYPPYQGAVKIYTEPPTGIIFEEIGWISAEGDFNNPWAELLQKMQADTVLIYWKFRIKYRFMQILSLWS